VVFIAGAVDDLNSPSARLTVGRVIKAGTGCFDVVAPVALWHSDTCDTKDDFCCWVVAGIRLVHLNCKLLCYHPSTVISLFSETVSLELHDGYNLSSVKQQYFTQDDLLLFSFLYEVACAPSRTSAEACLTSWPNARPQKWDKYSVAWHHQPCLTVCVKCRCCATSLFLRGV